MGVSIISKALKYTHVNKHPRQVLGASYVKLARLEGCVAEENVQPSMGKHVVGEFHVTGHPSGRAVGQKWIPSK